MEPEKFNKLIQRIDKLISELNQHREMRVHAEINQFYYMQKVTELQVIHDQFDMAQKHFEAKKKIFEETYRDISARWSKDARWLNQHIIGKLPDKNSSGSTRPKLSSSILV